MYAIARRLRSTGRISRRRVFSCAARGRTGLNVSATMTSAKTAAMAATAKDQRHPQAAATWPVTKNDNAVPRLKAPV